MAQIHILDSETIDKIAAGEVVERPASVVKELVENAIDAKATAVTVEIKDGGIELVRVTDNGCGMERDQIRKAFLRHATSKISNAEDLIRVSSLGFRGEALSSIAAVSKTEVITKTKDSMTGIRILLEGGMEKAFEEVGAPDGTTFLMRNLFYNTPVRRKFLKQPATEGSYIADLMEHLALSRPDISFQLIQNGQMKFHTSGNGNLKEVIYRVYGRETASALVPIAAESDGIRVEGYLGEPIQVRSNRNHEICFINGRYIKSNVIFRAAEEGYKEYLMQHKFPFFVLHFTMDGTRVDVNVHPTKMDVRFTQPMAFAGFLSDAVRQTLQRREMIPEAYLTTQKERNRQNQQEEAQLKKEKVPEPFEQRRIHAFAVKEDSQPYEAKGAVNGTLKAGAVQSLLDRYTERKTPAPVAQTRTLPVIPRQKPEAIQGTAKATEPAQEPVSESAPGEEVFFTETSELPETDVQKECDKEKVSAVIPTAPARDIVSGEQMNLFEEKILTDSNRRKFRIIGQVFETYWLIEFEQKLLMIDQHAAHEKVNYERLMKQYREKAVVSQSLLPPVIVSLSAKEIAVIRENRERFADLGFEIEEFGGNEYALRSVPADLYGCDEKRMFLEVLDELSEDVSFGGLRVVEEKIASMSCKAAVKGNSRISLQEAEALIDELLTLDNPYHCPHGRPTIVAMTKAEMEKKFKRII